MVKAKKAFDELRKSDVSKWALTLWLVKHQISQGQASYSALRVNADDKLKKRLRGIVTSKIDQKNYKIEPYKFASEDQDEQLLTIDTEETDFSKIKTEIDKGTKAESAKDFSDLLNSWAYVVHLQHGDKHLYALRKISTLSQAKKVSRLTSLFFENHMLVDLEDRQVFTIDSYIDFFVYAGVTFITNKKEFESALNFRKGMEANRDSVINEMDALKRFTDIEPFRRVIGSNMRLLRRMSMIQKSAYYKDIEFMNKLVAQNKKEKWNLTITKDRRIEVTEENVELILTLLNNARLRSLINEEVFDATVKTKVS